ncbi:DNA repair protein rad2 [Puccinia graminis f. sp. tritici]|uniref:DNA repair protein rad2 n=2 Tax=Puccinia graminis f. sp. tritici TaxID=56615 RepID=A0A5B0MXZ4_PUCGR|nr:DNA repair protein rad2 [Puccinia graminis f. sp. tritici]KAA1131330.1 DNA repair protein rad2 [Puccinia graminis f. sp. tritici]
MGVQGLWTLISPVARPVNLETMGSKKLAIDSSIWLYQFQKAMRDREGKGIVNAHILGFLRRISKLLYYGIKPVFVFDGGVPTLKKQTINERKKRKRGVQENLAKTAEKLLAAQLRQAAVIEAQKRSQVKATGELITPDAVYFDHPIAQDFSEKNTARKKRQSDPMDPTATTSTTTTTPIPSPTKKSRFVPKDQYQLPPIEKIPSVTENDTDHRLATEMELKQFIHEFTPEDLDINSPHFQSLSTELKYEIIGDLRIKSRQPNRTRVEAMRKTNDHEFSQTQILNLKKRNDLTQKLLTVTDMVAKANLTIPIKIAAQRNKEYVLVKASEGWILGIENDDQKDTGSATNPVKVDAESEDEDVEFEEVKMDTPKRDKQLSKDSDDELEFEEVPLPAAPSKPKPTREQQEADWREAIRFHYGTRDPDSVVEVEETSAPKSKDEVELFRQSDEEDEVMRDIISELVAHDTSNQSGPNRDLGEGSSKGTRTMTPQNKPTETPKQQFNTLASTTSPTKSQPHVASKEMINSILESVELEEDDNFLIPSTIPPLPETQTASQANPTQTVTSNPEESPILSTEKADRQNKQISQESDLRSNETVTMPDDDTPQVTIPSIANTSTLGEAASEAPKRDQDEPPSLDSSENRTKSCPSTVLERKDNLPPEELPKSTDTSSNDPSKPSNLSPSPSSLPEGQTLPSTSIGHVPISQSKLSTSEANSNLLPSPTISTSKETPSQDRAVHFASDTTELDKASPDKIEDDRLVPQGDKSPQQGEAKRSDLGNNNVRSESPEISIPWSRTPTPERSIEKEAEAIGSDEEEFNRVIEAEEKAIDANLAMESNEWESFLSGLEDQEKLEGIRQEADSEVQRLKEQKAKDRRDADDVNLQMSQDIQNLLKLFGIPFVVSPMEAEAQCAELLKLGLVDGIITDDSDVFLFGGHRVYKNLFNQNKFVECYLMNDLDQELGLDQQKLIQLAFLLGSDYTVGLNGVGPVTAMEILSEFDPAFSAGVATAHHNPNLSGLLNFKNWWEKVQVGKDTELESRTSFRKKFRKKKDKIWIDDHWPNPAVAEAYLHPTVDHSTEKFVWGLPDLDGIREFLYDHLSWSSIKTDEVIVPLIKRQTQRLNGTVQTQGVLDDFFDYSVESNKTNRLAPPRIDSGISSQRLQKIVQNWREKKKKQQANKNHGKEKTTEQQQQEEDEDEGSLSEEVVVRPSGKRSKRAKPIKPTAAENPPRKVRKTQPKKKNAPVDKPSATSRPATRQPARSKQKEASTQAVQTATRSSKRIKSNPSKKITTKSDDQKSGETDFELLPVLGSSSGMDDSQSDFDVSSSLSDGDDEE